MTIDFVRLTRDDLPLLGRWFEQPHVRRWWLDANSDPVHLEQKYGPRIDGTWPEVFIVHVDGGAVGLIQWSPMENYAEWYGQLEEAKDAIGIDYLIGEPHLVARGIGTCVIREFVKRLWDRFPEAGGVVADPQPANTASCRVLEKNGFRAVFEGRLGNDPVDSRVYRLDRPAAIRRALLFDYDGVIVDSETVVGRAFIDVLAEDGVHLSFDDFGHLLGTTGTESDERWQRFISDLVGPSAVLEEIERRMTPAVRRAYDELTVLPGVRELIDAARAAGWATGLGTGNTGPLDDYLERLGLSSAFDAVVRTHGSGLASKPAPDVFLTLAEKLGVAPEHCVVVEDSVPGCQAAISAGMTYIVCPTIATAGCTFPDTAVHVASLTEVTIDQLEKMIDMQGGPA